MAWPTAQDYSEAVQNPRLNFQDAELKTGQVELTPLGLPRPRSGNFATVYRMQCGQHHWAVRCFLRNVTDQQQRYAAISEYLRLKRLGRIQLPYMVDFKFLEDGIKVSGQWYPILKMEWVEGELLDKFIEKHLPNSTTLRHLAERWVTMTQTLESVGIAHGDLQHGNILIVQGELKLIDYDGMFVPTLFGFSSNEVGHSNYQSPSRTGDDFRADIDRFSAWVIYIALISLSIDPSLWQRVGAGDEFILLRKEDFVKPDTSATLALLAQHNDALIHSLITEFKQLLRNPAQIPPLEPQKVIVSTTRRPVSNANQGTTTHTISTSSDWLTDYLPQPQQKSSPSVQSPPISVKPTSHTVKSQTIAQSQSTSAQPTSHTVKPQQSQSTSVKPTSHPVKPKTRAKKWLTSKLVFVGLLIVGLLIVGMIFLGLEIEKRELAENLRVCEKHFQANRLTTASVCYEKVLEKYPTNAEALAGLEQIEAHYVTWIKVFLDQGQQYKAKQYLASLRKVNPDSLKLAALETRLQSLKAEQERLALASQREETEKRELDQKLRECVRHFKANRLTRARGGNALACYQAVLKKDPNNAQALKGLKNIEGRYIKWAKRALKKGQANKAKRYLASLRQVNPQSSQLAELESRLSRLSSSNRYTDNGNGTVTDNKTGIIWLKNANCFGKQNWETAMRSAAKLAHGECALRDGSRAGMWRLPTKDDWKAMIDKKYKNSDWSQPGISNAAGTGPWKEGDAFSGVQTSAYWSSTEYANDNAWRVYLRYGGVPTGGKDGTYYVWPVRRRQ